MSNGIKILIFGLFFGALFASFVATVFYHVIAPNITPVAVTATEIPAASPLSPSVTVRTNYRIGAVGATYQQNGQLQESVYCINQTEQLPCVFPRPVGDWLLMVHDGQIWHYLTPHDGELLNAVWGWHRASDTHKFFVEE